jgi:hypothetical protein
MPTLIDVAAERLLFVLGENVDAAQARVEAVGKSYIDNSVNAAKRYCWLTAIACQREEPLTGSSG